MLSNRNCFELLVKMISASPIARLSVIQILDDADAAFRILGAGLRTVLSVTTIFADKPHLNGRMRAAILCFDDLASGYRTRGWATRAAGYRAAISCPGTKRTCRGRLTMSAPEGKTDVPREPGHFRFLTPKETSSPHVVTPSLLPRLTHHGQCPEFPRFPDHTVACSAKITPLTVVLRPRGEGQRG
jgi:hypothetical protein